MQEKQQKQKLKKIFTNLYNNNFVYDCRNNLENCSLELIYDDLNELSYIKMFNNVFQNQTYQEFFTKELLLQQVDDEFNGKFEKLDVEDRFYFSKKEELTQEKDEEIEGIEMFFKKKRKRKLVSTVPNTIENKIKNCEDIRKNKVQIEFNDLKSSSVKFLGVKNQTNIKCSSRFLSGKLLMFAKLSLKTFVYSLVELLHFPEENPIVADIYKKYKIDEIQCYQILTDTDSTSIQFIIVSDPASAYPECDVRDILFETFKN